MLNDAPIQTINKRLAETPHNKTEHDLPDNKPKHNSSYFCQWFSCKLGVIISVIIAILICIGSSYSIATYAFDKTIDQHLRINHTASVQIILEGENALQTFKKNSSSISTIESIVTLKQDFANYKDITDKKYDIIYNMLSNSLTMVTIIIAVFGLFFGLFGFYIAAYISKKYDEVSKLENEVSALTVNAKEVNQSIVNNYEEIKNFFELKKQDMYLTIEKHDTALIIDRLKTTPEYIKHVLPTLLMRNNDDDDIWQEIYECYLAYNDRFSTISTDIAKYYFLFLLATDSRRLFNSVDLLSLLTQNNGDNDCINFIAQAVSQLSYPQLKNLFLSLQYVPDKYIGAFNEFIKTILTNFSVISLFFSFLSYDDCVKILDIIYNRFGSGCFEGLVTEISKMREGNKSIVSFIEIAGKIEHLIESFKDDESNDHKKNDRN